jgi:hypothetical protein
MCASKKKQQIGRIKKSGTQTTFQSPTFKVRPLSRVVKLLPFSMSHVSESRGQVSGVLLSMVKAESANCCLLGDSPFYRLGKSNVDHFPHRSTDVWQRPAEE